MEIKHNLVKEQVKNDIIKMEYLPTESMISVILTKSLGPTNFNLLRPKLLGMSSIFNYQPLAYCLLSICKALDSF